ncbi:MAG: glycosyltransferase family 4 protein [Thermoanaerobaculia bacterium]|nr:glycosyltransferase family 4 protein [Thermoanaerobaculia bacterium]
MNIAFISNLWPPTIFGGYEILAAQIASLFRQQGHRVEVLTSNFVRSPPRGVTAELTLTCDLPREGEDVGEVDFSLARQNQVRRQNRRLTIQWLRSLPHRFSDGRGADLVFCWCLNRLSLGPVQAAQALGLPVCQTVNDFHPRQFRTAKPSGVRSLARRLAEHTIYRGSTLATVSFPAAFISRALEEGLSEEGVAFDSSRIIRQGIPLESFPYRPRRRSADQPLELLYVGQISRNKGVHTLIQALGLLRLQLSDELGIRLRLVGDGVPEYENELEQLAATYGIERHIRWVGRVKHRDVAEWHRRSHILVFPSEWPEPFGLAHLEAMASGCAVVSTVTGGSAELIEDRVNALAFQAGRPEHLASCLHELSTDEDLRLRLIRRARRQVEEEFSLGAYGARLLAFLEETRRRHLGVPLPVHRRSSPVPARS